MYCRSTMRCVDLLSCMFVRIRPKDPPKSILRLPQQFSFPTSFFFGERRERCKQSLRYDLIHCWISSFQSKKRGLSLEEKREKMLQIFYDSQDFFLLKELEKMGPKKGVISQSVKDVIQSLVDDDLVAKDKIGISVYFWSLPSCAGNQLRSVRQKLESDLQGSNKKLAELVDQCDALKKGREDSEERTEALAHLQDIEKKHKELKNEMVQFADNDPATLEAMRAAIEVAHQSANRWTDNIFTLRQWCSNNFPQAKEQLEHLYTEAGITEDFDYLELSSFPLSSSSHDPETPKQLLVEDQA
ncbi:BnaA03g49390D [Brassica napus]|uniref:BnaA03g49390D protein n=1 Tax=Brassica napus TaxID=3708 RepID=A0A078GXJ6_BRANA|nr:BnaA03g49390D [Brassica napus]